MADEGMRLVLRGDVDPADAAIQAVREREIDDAEFPAERDRGLRAPVGELLQAAAAAAGEDHRDGAARGMRRESRAARCGFRPGAGADYIVDDAHVRHQNMQRRGFLSALAYTTNFAAPINATRSLVTARTGIFMSSEESAPFAQNISEKRPALMRSCMRAVTPPVRYTPPLAMTASA